MLKELKRWVPSSRERRKTKGLVCPALGFSAPAESFGSRVPFGQGAPLGPWLTSKLEVCVTVSSAVGLSGSLALQGESSDLIWYLPHLGGVSSTEWGPPGKCSVAVENGASGMASRVTVSCPVPGSGSTRAGILIRIPSLGESKTT